MLQNQTLYSLIVQARSRGASRTQRHVLMALALAQTEPPGTWDGEKQFALLVSLLSQLCELSKEDVHAALRGLIDCGSIQPAPPGMGWAICRPSILVSWLSRSRPVPVVD
jgi:hypothetical protein